jgi:CrcB protein
MTPLTLLQVAFGSALGGVARYLATLTAVWWLGTSSGHIIATAAINILGSFAIGLAYGLSRDDFTRHFIGIGFLGGFTTFSSFSAQTLELMQNERVGAALTNVGASVALSLLAVWAGWACAQILRPRMP